MKKRLLLSIFVFMLTAVSFGQTFVTATKILDNQGNLLATGQWCFGTTCLTVTNGAIPTGSSVTAATAAITITSGSNTYLTIPAITIAGSIFSFDTFVVPASSSITGLGAPRIACNAGAKYTQTDTPQNVWNCLTINGTTSWNGVTQQPQLIPGPQGPTGPTGPAGTGCGTGNCIITIPTTSQTITQPSGTSLNIAGSLLNNGSPIPVAKKFYGNLFNVASGGFTSGSLSSFTANGSASTPTVTGGAFQFTGGVSGFGNSFDLNQFTTLPQWSISATMTVGPITGSSQGLGFGIRSYEAGINAVGSLNTETGANLGYLFLYAGTSNSATSATPLSFSAGDSIRITVSRQFDTITVSASDLTTNSAAVSVSYQYQLAYPAPNLLPNRGRFAIFNFGGTQTVTSLNISAAAPVSADLLCVGDSKTVSYYAGSYLNGFCQQLQLQMSAVNESGGSDTTTDVLALIPEIIALKPKAVLLNIGRNDIAGGVSFSVYSANYASIVTQLQNAGIVVYHLLPIYETAVNQAPLTAYIEANYPAANMFDAGLQNYAATPATVLAADGIHPNPFGETLVTQAALAFFSGLGYSAKDFSYQASLTNCFSQTVGAPNFGCPAYHFGTNLSQTNTLTNIQVGALSQTSDPVSPFSLSVLLSGGSSTTTRMYSLQTQQAGSSNSGILCLQCVGGNLYLGGTPTLLTVTGAIQNIQVDTNGNITGSGGVTVKGTITTAAVASETVTVTGMTSNGVCAAPTPKNTSASTSTGNYISGYGANAITFNHTATAGMQFDFLCRSN